MIEKDIPLTRFGYDDIPENDQQDVETGQPEMDRFCGMTGNAGFDNNSYECESCGKSFRNKFVSKECCNG